MVSLAGFGAGMLGGASINIVINAVDNYSKEMKKAESTSKKFGIVLKKVLKIGVVGVAAGMGLAVNEAMKFQKALIGLQSIAKATGNDVDEVTRSFESFSEQGYLNQQAIANSEKNLLAAGFTLQQTTKLMNGLTDAAAFNRQGTLSWSDAVEGATQGIKNQNSILVDNAGITKNISVILKEQGYTMQDLSDATKGENARLALFNGLMNEAAMFEGDAAKAGETLEGKMSKLKTTLSKIAVDMANDTGILGVMEKLVGSLGDAAEGFKNLDKPTKQMLGGGAMVAGGAAAAGLAYSKLRGMTRLTPLYVEDVKGGGLGNVLKKGGGTAAGGGAAASAGGGLAAVAGPLILSGLFAYLGGKLAMAGGTGTVGNMGLASDSLQQWGGNVKTPGGAGVQATQQKQANELRQQEIAQQDLLLEQKRLKNELMLQEEDSYIYANELLAQKNILEQQINEAAEKGKTINMGWIEQLNGVNAKIKENIDTDVKFKTAMENLEVASESSAKSVLLATGRIVQLGVAAGIFRGGGGGGGYSGGTGAGAFAREEQYGEGSGYVERPGGGYTRDANSLTRDPNEGNRTYESVYGGRPVSRFAKGGLVTKPTLALIGEAGPEMVTPLGKRGGGMGGVTVNIGTVQGLDADDIANALQEKLNVMVA